MPKTLVYLKKSNRPEKKYMVLVDGKTIHFGAAGMSDYTKHKDKDRMRRYSARHKRGGENWGKSGIKTAGFWSKWLLWNKPTIEASKRDIASRFNVLFKNSWPNKMVSTRKSIRKSRKRKSTKKSSTKFAIRKSRKLLKKYERCVLAVKSKQSKKCFKLGKWVGGKYCANPWAICTSSVINRK